MHVLRLMWGMATSVAPSPPAHRRGVSGPPWRSNALAARLFSSWQCSAIAQPSLNPLWPLRIERYSYVALAGQVAQRTLVVAQAQNKQALPQARAGLGARRSLVPTTAAHSPPCAPPAPWPCRRCWMRRAIRGVPRWKSTQALSVWSCRPSCPGRASTTEAACFPPAAALAAGGAERCSPTQCGQRCGRSRLQASCATCA